MPSRPDRAKPWFDEAPDEPAGQRLLATRNVHQDDTGPQRIRIFDNPAFGRVLALDGYIQTTERDEFIYHEMIAHVPILAHGAVRSVLVVGGGDGGTLREVLRHKTVQRAVLVEIDPRVVELSRRYLPSIAAGAFDDPRAEIVIADGATFVRDTTARFDVILIDSTDPVGPGAKLSSAAFFALCRARLRPGGVLVAQSGVAFLQRDQIERTVMRLRETFSDVGVYTATVPTYYGGPMSFAWASDAAHRHTLSAAALAERFAASGIVTRYYTPALHQAAFVLPPYLEDLLSDRTTDRTAERRQGR
ncbi:MAG TPA: polyamine aminopropyltransferase [Alphaproteobacteria bacterium]